MQRHEREWFFDTGGDGVNMPAGVLAGFLLTLADDLNVLTAQASELFDGQLEFATPAIEVLQTAWLQVRQTVPRAWQSVRTLDEATLRRAGLTGAQLRLKITAWDESRQALDRLFGLTDSLQTEVLDLDPFFDLEGPLVEASALAPHLPRLRRSPRRLWGRLLRRIAQTLGYGDTILGSIPAVKDLIEPIKEYKEIVEKLSGDAGDVLTR